MSSKIFLERYKVARVVRARGVCERRVKHRERDRGTSRPREKAHSKERQDIDLVQLLFVVVDALEALLCCGRGGGFEPIQFNSIQFVVTVRTSNRSTGRRLLVSGATGWLVSQTLAIGRRLARPAEVFASIDYFFFDTVHTWTSQAPKLSHGYHRPPPP